MAVKAVGEMKETLVRWAEVRGVTPAMLAKWTGWSYQHAWDLLRGKRDVTVENVGRVVMTAPCEDAAELYRMMKEAGADGHFDLNEG